jgi:hypothetical protein
MARFRRLTHDDLTIYTRDELLPKLEAEQKHWARKEKLGLSAADQQARRKFREIVHAVFNPDGLAVSMGETAAWFKGERPTDSAYFQEKPVQDRP